jgi:hypothetical protein
MVAAWSMWFKRGFLNLEARVSKALAEVRGALGVGVEVLTDPTM